MNLENRIRAFIQLGNYLRESFFKSQQQKINQSKLENQWFTISNINKVIIAWGDLLTDEALRSWLNPYALVEPESRREVLIVMAGNIPLVGLHDLLSVLITGHRAVIKLSSNDKVLMPVIIERLLKIAPYFKSQIESVENIKEKRFDAVITTGNDNSSKYFEYYFKDVEKIIRKNRRSIAVLTGEETNSELQGLADDVFSYFGLGCRNVSKIFLPEGYDLNRLFKVFYAYSGIIEHKKYANNYDYNKAIFLMGNNDLVENGFLLLKEDKSLLSPVAMLYYEYYTDIDLVQDFIKDNSDILQCVVSNEKTPFGHTQKPKLWDYADGVDTVEFLRSL
ncbi:MAG: acyl-CoA reductase [Flavobacteriales bacterium]|nr:acyl-CoA reductase [Flavobacteriales bacterium]|tara:strand:+ start:152 stop:1156 length:1005 start_codon:yes stop_codon:yes gene_type:complete